MKITLVRHAEVDEEYIGCYNGHNDIGLSQRGHKQVISLSKKLDSSNFDAVFCSDLFRAKETIKHSAHAKDAIYTDRLREKSWGRHEGMSYDEIISEEKIEYIDFLQWIKSLDGEPYEDYMQRVEDFFIDYLPSLKHEEILVVTHAGVIRSLISLAQNIPLEEAFNEKIEYGSYLVYDTKNGDFIYEDL